MTLPAAVLFDMDGTLIDTEPLWLQGETAVMAAFGYEWTGRDQHACFGLPMSVVSEYMAQRVSGVQVERIVDELLDTMHDLMRRHFAWSPGARKLLREVLDANVPTALVSASWRRLVDVNIECISADLGVRAFGASVAGDEVRQGKPDPESYLLAAQMLGVDPRTCVVVEDSPAGVAAGLATGARVVGIEHISALGAHPRLTVLTSLAGVTLDQLSDGSGGGVPPQAGQMA